MYTWQFVDSIASSPTVRLDLNTLTAGIFVTEQPELSPPELRRVVSASMLADGEKIPAAAFANRTIKLPLYVSRSTADLQATVLQNLARELARQPGNILRVQLGTTNPIFFRTFPAPDATYQISMALLPQEGRVTLEIPCEPFGYGLEEVLTPVTVANNPASANGLFLDITSPKGDVETPLYLTVANGVVGTGRRRSALAVRRRGTVSAVPLFLQAEAMTLASNVTLPGADALMSGGGSSYARIAYTGTTNVVGRLTIAKHPSSASTDARGTYRVYARVRQSVGTDVHQMRIVWGGTDVQVTNDTVTLPTDVGAGAPTIKMIDLGLIQIPVGFDPLERGMSGVEVATEGVFLSLQSGRTSGTGTLDVDYLMFLPADDKVELIMWPATATVTDFIVAGGPSPSVYARNASAQITSTQAVEIAGTGLMITPNRTNRVFFHRDVGTGTALTGSGDTLSATTSLTPSYFPRYLFPLKPVST
jgi:hypothetical protein